MPYLAMTQQNGKVIELETSEELSERVSLYVSDSLLYKITYWEIPGKERHLKFINHYCLGATAALVLYDSTKHSSFEKAEKIFQCLESCEIPYKFLIGNKVD